MFTENCDQREFSLSGFLGHLRRPGMHKVELSRLDDYRIIEVRKGGNPELVGKRCRIMLMGNFQDVEKDSLGFLPNLTAWMLSGKYRDSRIDLPPVKLRYASMRKCYCVEYVFPHAPGFGKCKASKHEEEAPKGLTIRNLFVPGDQDE